MGYKVVRADLEKDRGAVLHFWNAHHKGKLQLKYQHFYIDNPAGKAKLWLLKKEEEQGIAGMIALFPRTVFINSTAYSAGVIGDIFVAPRHRALGPAIMLLKGVTRYVDSGKVGFVYTFPNEKADLVTRRVGFTCLGNLDRFARVIDYQPYLRGAGIPSPIIRCFAPMVNLVNRFFSGSLLSGRDNSIVCKRVMQVDSSFDELWEKVKNDFVIIGDRSSKYLQWRMLFHEGVVFAVLTRDNHELLGYMACSISGRFLSIRDFILPPREKDFSLLFAAVARYAYDKAAQGINVHLLINEHMESALKRYGYHKRQNNRKIYFYRGSLEGETPFLLENYKNWFLISGDSDSVGTTFFTAGLSEKKGE